MIPALESCCFPLEDVEASTKIRVGTSMMLPSVRVFRIMSATLGYFQSHSSIQHPEPANIEYDIEMLYPVLCKMTPTLLDFPLLLKKETVHLRAPMRRSSIGSRARLSPDCSICRRVIYFSLLEQEIQSFTATQSSTLLSATSSTVHCLRVLLLNMS
jgi:hypothetical protein